MNLKIGIDLDNTIIDYEKSFLYVAKKFNLIEKSWNGNKNQLKNKINNKIQYHFLQSKVYGEFINKAEIMPYFLNFLSMAKDNNCQVFIISHKTKFGYQDDKKINLQNSAKKFLKKKLRNFNSLLNENNIFFQETKNKKIKLADEMNFDFFIDDMKSIVLSNKLKCRYKKIFFNRYSSLFQGKQNVANLKNWKEIIKFIFKEEKNVAIQNYLNLAFRKKYKLINKIYDNGNNEIYLVTNSKNKKFILKYYSPYGTGRQLNEFNAIDILNKNKVNNIPKVFDVSYDFNISIFQYLKGKKLKNINNKNLLEIIYFVKKINNIDRKKIKNVQYSKEHCLSYKDLLNQINLRINFLEKVSYKFKNLNKFLNTNLIPFFKKIKKEVNVGLKKNQLTYSLEKNNQILNHNDLGGHNILKDKSSFNIIDFEYFGKDDVSKLICDFILHPGSSLDDYKKKIWIKEMFNIFSNIKNVSIKTKILYPLFAIRWSLIVLKKFNLYLYEKPTINEIRLLNKQIEKSITILEQVQKKEQLFNIN